MPVPRWSQSVLVTGGGGALGRHLVKALLAVGAHVTAWSRDTLWSPTEAGEPIVGPTWVAVDIRVTATVERALDDLRPDVIYHLAGTRTGSAAEIAAVNVQGFANLAEALARRGIAPRVVVAGSSAQYGLRSTEEPLREDAALLATTWYGVTKSAQETLALGASRSGLFPVIAARLFNLVGPGQRRGLLGADIAHQLVDPRAERLVVGPLDGVRDFVDYRDAARALVLLGRSGDPGRAYNVASGRGCSVRDLVEDLVAQSGRVGIDVEERRPLDQDGRRVGSGGPDSQVGDASTLATETGWRPCIDLTTSSRDLLAACAAERNDPR